MKKVLSLVLALSMVLGSFSMAFANTTVDFTDEATYLNEQGILQGSNGDLKLDENLTRQEAYLMVARLLGEEEEALNFMFASGFADASKIWKWDNVAAWAKGEALTTGKPGNIFDFTGTITFQEVYALMLRAMGKTVAWGEVMTEAAAAGLTVDGEGEITRAQLAGIVVNTLESEEGKLATGLGLETPNMEAARIAAEEAAKEAAEEAYAALLVSTEEAVAAYEAMELTTLEEVIAAEAVVIDLSELTEEDAATFQARIDVVVEAVALAKAELEAAATYAELLAAKELEVANYEEMAVTTLEEVAIAEAVVIDLSELTEEDAATLQALIDAKDLAVEAARVGLTPVVVEDIFANNYKEIVITFNKELNEDTVVIDNFGGDVDTANDTVALNEDGKSVTITLDNSNALSAYDSFEVDVEKIEDTFENVVADTTVEIELVFDIEKPVVESVVATANNKVKVTFSEPVQGPLGITNFYLNGKLFAGAATVTERVVTLELSKRLESDVYELTVRGSKIKDYADLFVAETKVDFVVEEDAVAPTVKYDGKGSQTELVFNFSEAVAEYTVAVDGLLTTDYTKELSEDAMTLTLVFDQVGKYVPVNGTTVTFTNIKDGFGNVTKEVIFDILSVTIDIERPEIEDITVDGQDTILVDFKEVVNILTGTYTLTDAKDNDEVLSAAYYVDEDGDTHKDIVELSGASAFAPGEYTLAIEEVEDISPLQNKVIPFSIGLTVADETKVEVKKITIDSANNRMVIEFTEEVDVATAIDAANYTYVGTDLVTYKLTNNETVTLLEDNKTVEIAFSDEADTADVTDVKVVQVKSVADLYTNVMTTAAFDSTSVLVWSTTMPDAPEILSAKVVDANTMEVTLDSDVLVDTISPTDFVIDANGTEISVIDVAYDADNTVIILTVNADLETDGTYIVSGTNEDLTLALATEVVTVDVYGQPLAIDAGVYDGSVTDGVVPVAVDMTQTDLSNFDINLSEDITLAGGSEYLVFVNGVLQVVTTDYTMAEADGVITVTFGSALKADDVVNVKFFPTASTGNKDAANNALEAFDLSITAE